MGCGSSASMKTDTGAPELKRPSELNTTSKISASSLKSLVFSTTVNGFTNATTRRAVLDVESVNLIYNNDESQEVDTPVLFKNEEVSLSVKGLKNLLKDQSGKYFPRVSYTLKHLPRSEAAEREQSGNDLLGVDQNGLEEKDASNFKVKLSSISGLNSGERYHLQVHIEDKRGAKGLSHLYFDYKFQAGTSGGAGRQIHKRDNAKEHEEKIDDITIKTRGELVYKKVSLSDGKIVYKPPYQVKFGGKIQMKAEGLKGFTTKDDLGNIGFSIHISDDQGNEIYYLPDLFAAENEYHIDELSEITTYIVLGGDNFNPKTTYTWASRLWDKFGNSQMAITTQYKGLPEVGASITVKEIKTEGGKIGVRFGGENGFIEGRIAFSYIEKKYEELFQKAKETEGALDLVWTYQENPKYDEVNMLHYVDKDSRKVTFWKLTSAKHQE